MNKVTPFFLSMALLALGSRILADEQVYKGVIFPGHGKLEHWQKAYDCAQKAEKKMLVSEYREALDLYAEAVSIYPYCAGFYMDESSCSLSLGDFTKAESLLKEALKCQALYSQAGGYEDERARSHRMARINVELAGVYQKEGNLDLASTCFQNAVRLKPSYLHDYAEFLAQNGRIDASKEAQAKYEALYGVQLQPADTMGPYKRF